MPIFSTELYDGLPAAAFVLYLIFLLPGAIIAAVAYFGSSKGS